MSTRFTPPTEDVMLSVTESEPLLGFKRTKIYALLDSGAIPYQREGRNRRIRLGDIQAFRERHMTRHAIPKRGVA